MENYPELEKVLNWREEAGQKSKGSVKDFAREKEIQARRYKGVHIKRKLILGVGWGGCPSG